MLQLSWPCHSGGSSLYITERGRLLIRSVVSQICAATSPRRSRTHPERVCLGSPEIGVYKLRMWTSWDTPENAIPPLHGGGQGFEPPRLHSKNTLLCRIKCRT